MSLTSLAHQSRHRDKALGLISACRLTRTKPLFQLLGVIRMVTINIEAIIRDEIALG